MQYNIKDLLAADSPDNNELAFHLMQHALQMEAYAALDLIFNLKKRCLTKAESCSLQIGTLKIEFRFENPLYMAQRGHKLLMCFCYRAGTLLFFQPVKEQELYLDFDTFAVALPDMQKFIETQLFPKLVDWLKVVEEGG